MRNGVEIGQYFLPPPRTRFQNLYPKAFKGQACNAKYMQDVLHYEVPWTLNLNLKKKSKRELFVCLPEQLFSPTDFLCLWRSLVFPDTKTQNFKIILDSFFDSHLLHLIHHESLHLSTNTKIWLGSKPTSQCSSCARRCHESVSWLTQLMRPEINTTWQHGRSSFLFLA